MSAPSHPEITRLLRAWSAGDPDALPHLVEIVYPELHRIAARHLGRERPGDTLQPTALVGEVYLRFAAQADGQPWRDRTHFFAVAARVARAVLVDHARSRAAAARGPGTSGLALSDGSARMPAPAVDLLDLDAALAALEAMDAEHARIVELRYFGGLSIEETAAALGSSPSSVKRGWLAAKTFIRRRLDGGLTLP